MTKKYLFLFIFFFISVLRYSAETVSDTFKDNVLSSRNLKEGKVYELNNWKLIPEDESKWQYDFSEFNEGEKISSSLSSRDTLWKDVVYLQTRVYADSSLSGKTMGFYFYQAGASEIFVNGIKIYSIGTIFPSAGNEFNDIDKLPRYINLKPGLNNISIRYSNHRSSELWNRGESAGFRISIGLLDNMISTSADKMRNHSVRELVFLIIPLTLAVIHFFLFLFNTSQKQNLIYSLFLIAFMTFIYTGYQQYFENNVFTIFFLNKLLVYSLLLTALFASASIRSIFTRLGKIEVINIVLFIGLSLFLEFGSGEIAQILIYCVISYFFALAGFSIFSPHEKKGSYILKTGYVLMSASGIYQMLQNIELLPVLFNEEGIFVYGVISFIFSMSVYLAYEFIRTGEELELKIEEVQKLSKENYEKELEAQKKEVDQRILEADNLRKTKELEDARQLQLSMLPKRIVNTKYFDIAVKMLTAVEVGGDYYDTVENDSGILNLTLGDATGHGNKAGIMVAIIKSLFISLGSSLLIPDFFKRCTAVIRKMKLGNLFMSLILMRTNGRDVILSSAGMPPILHYVKKNNSVREIVIKSMPLGAVKDFPYETEEFSLEPGDVLLLFSDGIVELFNEEKEFFGLKRLINVFAEAVSDSPDKIISRIFEEGDKWRGSAQPNDDITIMALKVK